MTRCPASPFCPYCDDTRPTPATPAGEELREAEGRFVAGPVWKEPELTDEDGEPIWTSEVQTIGGYSVIATVHGGSEAEATARRDAILAALQPQAAPACRCGGRIEGWTCQSCGQRFYEVNGTLQPQAEWE